jgi:hypothetical protein
VKHSKIRGAAVVLVLVLACVSRSQGHQCTLNAMAWMVGSWHNSADPNGSQEQWSLAPNGILMGSYWEFPKGKSGFAELMTIRPDGEDVSMILRHFDGTLKTAWEEGRGPMIFTASSCERGAVVFDGQGDHAGEHVAYRRSGNRLSIEGDFIHHGTPDHEEWHMIRAGN